MCVCVCLCVCVCVCARVSLCRCVCWEGGGEGVVTCMVRTVVNENRCKMVKTIVVGIRSDLENECQ